MGAVQTMLKSDSVIDNVDVIVIEQAAKLIAHSIKPDYAIQSILRLLSQMLQFRPC